MRNRRHLLKRILTVYLVFHNFMSIICLLQIAALAVYLSTTGKPRLQLSGWLDVASDLEIGLLIPLWFLSLGLFSLHVAHKLQRTAAKVGTVSVGLELFLILTPVYGLTRWQRLLRRDE